jgi:hypothetical protein
MGNFYKREVSLMDTKIFPRASLDMQIENPDVKNSVIVKPVEKTDKELVEEVVSALNKTGARKAGTT